jgi:hypothetical protein
MTYSIKKSRKASIDSIAKLGRAWHIYLEQESQLVYGSSYNALSIKEQKEISVMVAKKYPFSLRGVD